MRIVTTLRFMLLAIAAAMCGQPTLAELPPASFAISPNRVVMSLTDTTMQSAVVMNMGNKPVTIDASIVSWDLDEDNEFRALPTESGSLPDATIINPVRFTIPEGGSQTVRFMVQPERLAAGGEHRAMLFFSETVPTDQPGLSMRFRLGMPIYAQLDDANPAHVVHDVAFRNEPNSATVEFDIAATGNAHVRTEGYYVWWPANDFPGNRKALKRTRRLANGLQDTAPDGTTAGSLYPEPVLPGTRRQVASPVALPQYKGEYYLSLHLAGTSGSFERVLRLDL